MTTLEIFVGPPQALDPKDKTPSTKANLAHVLFPAPSQEAFDTVWKNSQRARLASLGGIDDPRAKAKVSFVLPVALAKKMGVMPVAPVTPPVVTKKRGEAK